MMDMTAGDGYFSWDKVHSNTVAIVQDCLAAMNILILSQPPYSPGLVPSHYFVSLRMNTKLEDISMAQETLQKAWDGVLRTIAKEDLAAVFRRW
jgi:hypothetical protein